MKAMILAAGLGTRLRPLTDHIPKALIEVNGIPLLERVIQRLKFCGFHDIIINVHHFAEHIIEFLQQKRNFGINIWISDETAQLLDTGGGLKQAAWFFDDGQPFLVHNVDILSDLDLRELYEAHLQSEALATLAVSNRSSSRYFLFNQEHLLCGWQNIKTKEIKITRPTLESDLIPLAFSGIHVLQPAIFDLMPEQDIFSITDTYIQLAADHPIVAFNHDQSFWLDLGRPDQLQKAGGMLSHLDKNPKGF
jgi:MurNAc alpha-1-phosphate uridylyltransferase